MHALPFMQHQKPDWIDCDGIMWIIEHAVMETEGMAHLRKGKSPFLPFFRAGWLGL